MRWVNDVLKAFLLVTAIFAVAELGLLLDGARRSANEANALIAEARRAVTETDRRLDGTFQNLNAILVQAGLVAARVEDLSRNVEAAAAKQAGYWEAVQVKTLCSLDRLNASADALAALLANTDRNLNSELIPRVANVADEAGTAVRDLDMSVHEASERANASLDDVRSLLADPAWKAALQEIKDTAAHVDGVSAQLEDASKSMPGIAKSIERISQTASRWRKALIVSQILSAIGWAFF
jgi:uncharacterized protein YoxC